MKNILMSILTVLIVFVIIIVMVKGINVGSLELLSVSQVMANSDGLKQKISDLNALDNVEYKKNLESLNTATKKLTSNKSKYLDVASVSSDTEIKEANQEEIYSMEYLWNKIGHYATTKSVNMKLEVSSSANNRSNLAFTVNGSYMAIRDFIYTLENDADLSFRIENFKLVSGGSSSITSNTSSTNNSNSQNQQVTQASTTSTLTCTFKVNNINIKQEKVSSSTSTGSSTKTTSSSSSQTNSGMNTASSGVTPQSGSNPTNTTNK